ncbi:MAG: hypothetical protein J6J35_00375 [Alphaproteobacteria bacterium]|nr:hypothetical protein [Alphaproteobacteria bacterium]
MRILRFFKSGAWRSLGRKKRCAEIVGSAPGLGGEVYNVSEVNRTDKTVLAKSVTDGDIIYQSDVAHKLFIEHLESGQTGVFDNGRQISVPVGDGVLSFDYALDRRLHHMLIMLGAVAYKDMVTGEVMDKVAFSKKQDSLSMFEVDYLAIGHENGLYSLYVFVHNDRRCGAVCRVTGAAALRCAISRSLYVLDDNGYYRFVK